MNAFVIDVNVAIVANKQSSQADDRCISACVDLLIKIQSSGKVVLDDGMLILDEYMHNLSMSGQPGLGDYFMRWLWENQALAERCERVIITPIGSDGKNFQEFPDDPALAQFDPDDRKYVAVACASRNRPTIMNAVDSDWKIYALALQKSGLSIKNICPQCLKD